MQRRNHWIFVLVFACFFLSGMAGLVYQTAWARYLGLFLGHTSYAVVAVLVAFMGGLAVGNAWLGTRADRTRRPLALYAWLEIGIGLYALLFPYYYEVCYDTYVACVKWVGVGTSGSLALKFLFSFLTILAPTILMGATFPALVKFATQSLSELREKVALLYCLNSGGAVAGCLTADFWWIPKFGLEWTVSLAAVLNLGVGIVALLLSSKLMEGSQSADATPLSTSGLEEDSELERFTPGELRLAVLCIGLSGFVAMLYEVVWTRMLGLALGSSTHAFSLMLVTFISGITVGAWIVWRWKNPKSTLDAFGWAEMALAVTLIGSLFFYQYLPFWFARLASMLSRQEDAYFLYALLQAAMCFAVLFIPTVCLGTTLPLVSRIATRELARTGKSVGIVFAVNTIGTVLGAALTGLWLMPWLGLARTLCFGMAINAAIAFLVAGRAYWRVKPARLAAIPVFVVAWTWAGGVLLDSDWRRMLTAGLWRSPAPPQSMASLRAEQRNSYLVYYRDGAGSTVNVTAYPSASVTNYGLKVNGKTDASTGADMATQVMSGSIPMFLKPNAKEVLVVGLGCGVTASAAIQHPGIESVEIVEISPEVVQGARIFKEANRDVHNHPKVRMVVDDAKSHLLATTRRYDVIISEPSNPWMAGVAGVFSQEFYESCRSRLAEDGLMVQWVQAYETSDATLEMVIATYRTVFPHIAIWSGAIDDLLLVGSRKPLLTDLESFKTRIQHPAVKADLDRVGVTSLPILLSHELVPAQYGAFLAPLESIVHTDTHPALEYVAQRAFFVRKRAEGWRVLDENLWPRPRTLLGQYLAKHPMTAEDCRGFVNFHIGGVMFPLQLVQSVLHQWATLEPNSDEITRFFLRIAQQPSVNQLAMLNLAPQLPALMKSDSKNTDILRQYAIASMAIYRDRRTAFHIPDNRELLEVLHRLIQTDKANERVYKLYLAEMAWDEGQDKECAGLLASALTPDTSVGGRVDFSLDRRAPGAVLARMLLTHISAGRMKEAWNFCKDIEQKSYVGPKASTKDPRLELLYRMLTTMMEPGVSQDVALGL